MTPLQKHNQLNKLYREFFTTMDEKIAIEQQEIHNDMKYAQKVQIINQLSTQITDIRKEIKMLKNDTRQYTLGEMMKAVDSYVHSTTNFNKSVVVTPKPSKNNHKFNAECIKTDNTRVCIVVTIQDDGVMFAFEGSVLRNIAEFIK